MVTNPRPYSKGLLRLAHGLGLLVVAITLAGCATSGIAPGQHLADTQIEGKSTAFQHTVDLFLKDLKDSTGAPADPDKAQKALQSGLAMLDLQCGRYLDAVGSANQASSNDRRQVGLAGGFASAIMGLTGSSAKEIAGVATAFSFSGSSMESYTTAYLFSDAASSVTKIVRESQKAWLDNVNAQSSLANMNSVDAVRLLVHYQQICRPAQIRALIDQSIAKGTVVAERTQASDADVLAVLQSLQAALGVRVPEADAILLYAWFQNPAQRDAGAKLSSAAPVASLLLNRTAQVLERQLAQGFLPVSLGDSVVPQRWAPGVKLLLPTTSGGGDAPAAMAPLRQAATPPIGLRPSAPVLSIR